MEIYRLSNMGQRLAHSYRAPRTPAWGVIYFLDKNGVATKEQILERVPGATSVTLAKLRLRHIVTEETGVNV